VVQPRAISCVQINGPALRVIRERSGISCSALARAVGTDVSFLARVERGEKKGLGFQTWERISYELEIDGRAILVDPFSAQPGPPRPRRGPRSRTEPARSGPTVVPCSSSTRAA
jgi:transcriptional regulator with XRE-family HTH domain